MMHRVAFLLPQVMANGVDSALAGLFFWSQQLDVCMRVPGLSVLVPAEVGGAFEWELPLAAEADVP